MPILVIFIILVVVTATIHLISIKRNAEINEIISDLEKLKLNPEYKEAAELNIEFFKAIRYPFLYIRWLIFRAPKIRKNRGKILELADLPLPEWQKKTHERFLKLERLFFPKIIQPIKKRVISEIMSMQGRKKPIILLDIGCGSMELERQIIEELVKQNFTHPVIFAGVDCTSGMSDVAFKNLSSLPSSSLTEFSDVPNFRKDAFLAIMKNLVSYQGTQKFSVVFLTTNIFNLETLPENYFDLVYHSRLKHHVMPEKRGVLEKITTYLSSKVIEFDDLCIIPVFIFPSIITWRWPLTLNGAILSYLRDPSKHELLSNNNTGWELKMDSNLGFYLRVYSKTERNAIPLPKQRKIKKLIVSKKQLVSVKS
ncbi:MAG: hypothetical protein PHF44_01125 [Candidatus Pacebacteria bacterium]|nr:hypothetical protein [Candidatus Paceibacterota bacterium]